MWRWDQIHNIVTIVDYSHIYLSTLQRKRMSVEKTLMFYVFSYISASIDVATQVDATLMFTTNLCILNMIWLGLVLRCWVIALSCKQDTIKYLYLEINSEHLKIHTLKTKTVHLTNIFQKSVSMLH